MSYSSKYIAGLLGETWFDITEEYQTLIGDWYGDDTSMIEVDDAILADEVRKLTSNHRYWHFNPHNMTSYEKLQASFNELFDLNAALAVKCTALSIALDSAEAREHALLVSNIALTKGEHGKISELARGKTNDIVAA